MQKPFILSILILLSLSLFAQKPEDILSRWSQSSPIEKIYLHLDRESYIAGETVWFKAYLSSDFLPDTISTNLYAELLRDTGLITDRKILPIVSGATHGQFELPDSLSSGYYQIRAYTVTQLNHDPVFIYRRNIFIYGKKNKTVLPVAPKGIYRMEFFPEGGNLVQGLSNSIAFKGTDARGLPADVKGWIRNQKNESVAEISSYHDGMGMFELTPKAGDEYYFIADGSNEKFKLPAAIASGLVLSVIPHPQGSFFEIKQNTTDASLKAGYMIGQMQHHIVFRQEFRSNQTEIQGVINTSGLHSGIIQVTVFSNSGIPLAERLCFVNNKEYIQVAGLVADTLNFNARGRNRFSLQLKDTVQGSFSISITDADRETNAFREENIYSRLLLTSDLKGNINDPAWYFRTTEDSSNNGLDLLMMVNGWRRFKWTNLIKDANNGFHDAAYITLAGKAVIRGTKKPFSNQQLLLLMSQQDNRRITQVIGTDKDGNFHIDSLLFFGNTRLLFIDVRGKKSQYIDILLGPDSLGRTFSIPAVPFQDLYAAASSTANDKMAYDLDAIQKANGTMLENITIKVTKKTPLQEVDDRYTKGMFSGDAVRAIDLIHSDDAMAYENIFDYLQSRIPGLTILKDGLDYTLFYRQVANVSSMGNIPMILFLDEVQTDASYISALPADQIALVKVFSSFAAADGNAPGGVLAIWTKKGKDYVNKKGFASNSFYQGYSIIKEFYAPDYQVKKETGSVDNRITLDWRPDIFSNYVNPSIPFSFYNNDRTKRFRVVIEGMTTSGKMVCLEKVIGPQ